MGQMPLTLFLLVAIVLAALYLRRLRLQGRPLVPARGAAGGVAPGRGSLGMTLPLFVPGLPPIPIPFRVPGGGL